jgi:DNA-3-methyladenine glycosylase II
MQAAIDHLSQNDPVMARIIGSIGPYALRKLPADFDTLVRSIAYQQLSGKVAAVILARLIKAAGGTLTPEGILRLRPSRMRALGLSTAKTNYIRDLARHARDGSLAFEELDRLTDDEVIERLTEVKGIGPWTAQMFLMFGLERLDVLPTGDLGIRAAMRTEYGLADLPTPAEMHQIARRWRPYCTVACWYLWRTVDGDANL